MRRNPDNVQIVCYDPFPVCIAAFFRFLLLSRPLFTKRAKQPNNGPADSIGRRWHCDEVSHTKRLRKLDNLLTGER